jgi:hypothetical protein
MRATNKRNDAEIISDIIKACENRPSTYEVVAKIGEVREQMKGPPWAGLRTTNRDYVEKLRKWIERGDTLFRRMPRDFNPYMLFAPNDVNWERAEEREEGLKRAEETQETFFGAIKWFSQRLDWLVSADLGIHGNVGLRQDEASKAARELCERHGLPIAYSSPTSAYRMTASLLFEAMTGEQGRDLERACEAMAAVPTWTETDRII